MARVLLVEDEDRLARTIRIGLTEEKYVVDRAADGREALWLAETGNHDAIVLDLRIPEIHGLEVCRRLRGSGSEVPILMLTASDTTEDVVAGLDAGADDYLTKPFRFEELLARLRALLRRGVGGPAGRLEVADLRLDTRSRRVWRGDDEVVLRPLEFRLLEHLVRTAGSVQSKARLAAAVWEDPLGPDSNALEVYISSLRRKLDTGFETKLLHTRRGFGYVLEVPAP